MLTKLQYLLLQIRNGDDPMREHEVACFSRALHCDAQQVAVFDLLGGAPTQAELDRVDMLLLGGSGHYSAAGEGPWLEQALDALRTLHEQRKPTFASCWGFQAMARALGGRVINDLPNAEVGTVELVRTDAGRGDPVFGALSDPFHGQAGHEDHVVELPPDAVRLASSALVANQAYTFPDRPIYCTQFHPELRRDDLLRRVRAYPEYVERIAGVPYEVFAANCRETPETEALLLRFVEHVFG